MDPIQLQTSSEEDNDDDDGYLNSVAKLKVLKKQSSATFEKPEVQTKVQRIDQEPQEESLNVSSTTPMDSIKVTACSQIRKNRKVRGRRYRTRSTTSKKKQLPTQNDDSDLEIVSFEKPPASDRNTTKDDLEIVEIETDELNDDQIYDISIKVLWRSRNVHRMNINENEKFEKIFQYFASLEGVSTNEILLMKKDRVIKKMDTPASINLSVIDILEGGIVQGSAIKEDVDEDIENSSVIKVQTTNKKSLTIRVRRDEDFMALFDKCAEELNVDKSKIRMYFDGELVSVTDTPDSLDIEEEACFDFRLSS